MPQNFTRASSIGAALDIVADHWMLLLLREFFLGTTTWGELEKSLRISPATLNKRLTQLIDAGCLTKERVAGQKKLSYQLTQAGKELFPFMVTAREWQLKWDVRPEAYVTPWVHECGAPLRCTPHCSVCDKTLHIEDVSIKENKTDWEPTPHNRHFRASSAKTRDKRSEGSRQPKVIEILGDRRACQLLAALLRGMQKFDEIEKWSGLHPAIISERLRKLQILGICHTSLYQENPDRYLYTPSHSGKDLFAVAIQLQHWGDNWLHGPGNEPTTTMHKLCNQKLLALVKCDHCKQLVTIDNTHVEPTSTV